MCAVFLFALAMSLLGLLRIGERTPTVHDEFAYLLGADTFSDGGLTNPTPPHWEHFESFQIFLKPTYQSKYPPAQSLFLALGQRVTGHPIAGVYLSVALFAAATCWMLYAFLPAGYALLGGLFLALQIGLLSYWSQTYWGGAVAGLGGALLFGGLERVLVRPRFRDGFWLGCGLLLLAHSRPYEGLVAALPVAIVLLVWGTKEIRAGRTAGVLRATLPIAALGALTLLTMGIYNRALTGDPLRLPHAHYHSIYNPNPLALFSSGESEGRELAPNWHPERRSTAASVKVHFVDLTGTWVLLIGMALTPALFLLPWVLKRRWPRFALLLILLVAASTLLSLFSPPHYLAPIACLVVYLLVECLRMLRCLRRNGRRIGRHVALFLVLLLLVERGVDLARGHYFNERDRLGARADLIARLEAEGGRHLVLVEYGPRHNTHQEWVYNSARIDDQAVVFARSLDAASNRALIDDFQGREIWSLRIDDDHAPPHLVPMAR